MSESPLIDIVIPNRNKAEFLPRTLAALRGQTETRWRAIVVDGESTDGSREILKAAADADPRFLFLSAKPSSLTGLSLYRSWNHGLVHVRAPFFAVLTSDDLWEPNWLNRALGALRSTPEAVAVSARALFIGAKDEPMGPTPSCLQFEESFRLPSSGSHLLRSSACALRSLLLGPIFSTIHALVIRREILSDGVIFAEDVGYLADIEYYLHICMRGDIIYDMDCSASFRTYATQVSSEAGGPMVSDLWRKLVTRNRGLVAQKVGMPVGELTLATEEILARHRFIMTKPDRETLRKSKLAAFRRTIAACLESPAMAARYARCRADRKRFLLDAASEKAQRLSRKYNLPEASPLWPETDVPKPGALPIRI